MSLFPRNDNHFAYLYYVKNTSDIAPTYLLVLLFSSQPLQMRKRRRKEGARGRCVTAGDAARAPDELKTREAETAMRNGRSEADLRVQRRDHEGPRVEHGAGAKRAHTKPRRSEGCEASQRPAI